MSVEESWRGSASLCSEGRALTLDVGLVRPVSLGVTHLAYIAYTLPAVVTLQHRVMVTRHNLLSTFHLAVFSPFPGVWMVYQGQGEN